MILSFHIFKYVEAAHFSLNRVDLLQKYLF